MDGAGNHTVPTILAVALASLLAGAGGAEELGPHDSSGVALTEWAYDSWAVPWSDLDVGPGLARHPDGAGLSSGDLASGYQWVATWTFRTLDGGTP